MVRRRGMGHESGIGNRRDEGRLNGGFNPVDQTAMPDHFSLPDEVLTPLLGRDLDGWRLSGSGSFAWVGDGILESSGGHGIFWYGDAVYGDFLLRLDWRTQAPTDNSGIFLRIPPLGTSPDPAIRHGYEIQIDDRGVDPETGRQRSPLHLTGAVYGLAPATLNAFNPTGQWNSCEVLAHGPDITVWLNGLQVSRLTGGGRRTEGHIGLQAHHEGSRVQFRHLRIARL